MENDYNLMLQSLYKSFKKNSKSIKFNGTNLIIYKDKNEEKYLKKIEFLIAIDFMKLGTIKEINTYFKENSIPLIVKLNAVYLNETKNETKLLVEKEPELFIPMIDKNNYVVESNNKKIVIEEKKEKVEKLEEKLVEATYEETEEIIKKEVVDKMVFDPFANKYISVVIGIGIGSLLGVVLTYIINHFRG